ncbi:unnamed protein product [Polarella glacialis]|uniref:HECT-type E3 ubiquitin transferase n=1 Tax=Polarella glacialis TaxID=89957 RepID=A0A813HA38_POLGL|nr:unnamed protein product [Polarella glacialis]
MVNFMWNIFRDLYVVLLIIFIIEQIPGSDLLHDMTRKGVITVTLCLGAWKLLQPLFFESSPPGGAPVQGPRRQKKNEGGKDQGLEWAASEMQGWRAAMEDAVCIVGTLPEPFENQALFAVFDGHGGSQVSHIASKEFPKVLTACANKISSGGGSCSSSPGRQAASDCHDGDKEDKEDKDCQFSPQLHGSWFLGALCPYTRRHANPRCSWGSMLCPSGHEIRAQGKPLSLFSRYNCNVCNDKVSRRGGLYHKCPGVNRCEFRVCGQCYQEAVEGHYDLERCIDAFPHGFGPLSAHHTSLQPEDLTAFDITAQRPVNWRTGGTWFLASTFFARSSSLTQLWSVLQSHGMTISCPATSIEEGQASNEGAADQCLLVQLSPAAAVSLPVDMRKGAGIPEGPDIFVVWLYPLQLEWQTLLGDLQDVDWAQPELSLLSVGGFVYIRAPELGSRELAQVVCATSIAYSPKGALSFASPLPWQRAWTAKLRRSGRFRKVTAEKWAAAGAQYMCWLRPGEALLAPRGRNGGFAFLFHGLDEDSEDSRDCFFEIASEGSLESEASRGQESLQPTAVRLRSSLPFLLVGTVEAASPLRQQERTRQFFQAATERRWGLVAHMLAEWPCLATRADELAQTALHFCALGATSSELLFALNGAGALLEAKNLEGRTAYDLGDMTFRALVSQVWGLLPDLFSEPEVWFDYWDKSKTNQLEPEELIAALAAAYQVGEVGRRWIETYVHIHYQKLSAIDPHSMMTKIALLSDGGLLHVLQSSDEFVLLRGKENKTSARMPAIFQTEGHKRPTAADKAAVDKIGTFLAAFRRQLGLRPGQPALRNARVLEVRAPFAGGDSDPASRMSAAREMLALSFAQTTARSSKEWLQGFKIKFKGGDDKGIDEGGLTKAWVKEIAYALWGDGAFFDAKDSGYCFFKADTERDLLLHRFHVKTESLYRWVGRFLAYAVYQGCTLDCRLCPWSLRWLFRVPEEVSRRQVPEQLLALAGDWQIEGSHDVIATICGSTLLSSPGDRVLPVETFLYMSSDRVAADLEDDEVVTASLEGGKLHWSDGEIWTRCLESPLPKLTAIPTWPETPAGDDQLLEDLASLDPPSANSLWRVQHEMSDEDLQWLTFSYAGVELEPGGDDREVDASSKDRYVRLCCKAALLFQAHHGLQAFSDGFFDVLPPSLIPPGAPADIFQFLLLGSQDISSEQLAALEDLVIPQGVMPKHFCHNPAVLACCRWVFEIARDSDNSFRSRLFEFWTGSPRLPIGGVAAITPKPRLQVMVQAAPKPMQSWEVELEDGWQAFDESIANQLSQMQASYKRQVEFSVRGQKHVVDLHQMQQVNERTGVRRAIRQTVVRIQSWPKTRLPEGHTCGNELWLPLFDSREELESSLRTSVMNFEAGFALA